MIKKYRSCGISADAGTQAFIAKTRGRHSPSERGKKSLTDARAERTRE